MKYSEKNEFIKERWGDPTFKLRRGSRVPLLNFKMDPGSRGPGPTFTPCRGMTAYINEQLLKIGSIPNRIFKNSKKFNLLLMAPDFAFVIYWLWMTFLEWYLLESLHMNKPVLLHKSKVKWTDRKLTDYHVKGAATIKQ